MNKRWRALLSAAADVCNANCRLHRERATARLQTAVDKIGVEAVTDSERDLLLRLALYVEDIADEDIEAERLMKQCRDLGLLPRTTPGG